MALGGGTWQFQNKVLPGTYINFVSRVRAEAAIADRGYATMPITGSTSRSSPAILVMTSCTFCRLNASCSG